MAEQIIGNLQLVINNKVTSYVPDSLKYTKNTAEIKVASLTTGGKTSTTVHSIDTSESMSKVSFAVKATKEMNADMEQAFYNIAQNVIELSSIDGSVALAFSGMSLTKLPELELGADAKIEVEFLGDSI